MASSDEAAEVTGILAAPRGANAGVTGEGGVGPDGVARRRQGSKQHPHEVMDQLAMETARVSLLDREEQQLKERKHVSRLLFVFGIVDDRSLQNTVEQEFASFRERQDGGNEVTGLMMFFGQAAAHFLEGPTEQLFKVMELFHGLSQEVHAAVEMPSPPADMHTQTPAAKAETEAPAAAAPRPALISALRVLYFTELHGVRSSVGWCSFVSTAKVSTGGHGNIEDGIPELVFALYKKFLVLCMKVQDSAGSEASPSILQNHYRKLTDLFPMPDEVVLLLGKQGAEHFFSFAEFQQVFMKPFQLVLTSELLWPMPPPLSY